MSNVQSAPERAPDIDGPHARAWLCERGEAGRIIGALVHAPHAHAFWHWRFVSLVSLADIPGIAPANKHYPEATHEITVLSLNPDKPLPNIDSSELESFHHLSPADVVKQFHGVKDADAIKIFRQMINLVVAGAIMPDSDHRCIWEGIIEQGVHHHRS